MSHLVKCLGCHDHAHLFSLSLIWISYRKFWSPITWEVTYIHVRIFGCLALHRKEGTCCNENAKLLKIGSLFGCWISKLIFSTCTSLLIWHNFAMLSCVRFKFAIEPRLTTAAVLHPFLEGRKRFPMKFNSLYTTTVVLMRLFADSTESSRSIDDWLSWNELLIAW